MSPPPAFRCETGPLSGRGNNPEPIEARSVDKDGPATNTGSMTASAFDEAFESWAELQQALRGESDLGIVLITTSYFDATLERILKAFLVDDGKSRDLLKGPNKPFSGLSNRINTCRALALITRDEARKLHRIRDVRNAFAHRVSTTFQDPDVAKAMAGMEMRAMTADYGPGEDREVFLLEAQVLSTSLLNRAAHVAMERRQLKEWPLHRTDAEPDLDLD